MLLLAFLSCVRRQVLTTSVQNFPSGHQINQPHIVLAPPIHLASLAVNPNAMDIPVKMVDFLEAYRGEITQCRGMYGRAYRFSSSSSNIQAINDKYRVRILTSEDCLSIQHLGRISCNDCDCESVPKSILSGLRVCDHKLRPMLVDALKQVGLLPTEFPALAHQFPVPGTCSFTTIDNFAVVYRVFVNRQVSTFFPTANTVCLVVDISRLQDGRDLQNPDALVEELSALMLGFPDFTLMEKWAEQIRETCETLREWHSYCDIDICNMMDVGTACLLPMCNLPARISQQLSVAAYTKQIEKGVNLAVKYGREYGTDVKHHTDLLYPGLLAAIQVIEPQPVIREWNLLRNALCLGITFQMEMSLRQHVYHGMRHLGLERKGASEKVSRLAALLLLLLLILWLRRSRRFR